MSAKSKFTVELLLRLKKQYGDLNRALVREYVCAFGETSERQIAQDVGLSRSAVKRGLQDRP